MLIDTGESATPRIFRLAEDGKELGETDVGGIGGFQSGNGVPSSFRAPRDSHRFIVWDRIVWSRNANGGDREACE